ncbi:MAG: histidine phosphatase family protein [bacterium]
MTKLYIVRHGKTDFNEQGRYAGRADISLNANGRQQTEELKQKIKDLNINIIISSPLKRAIETAEIIKPNDCKIISKPAFIERSVGVYESLTKEEAKEKYPKLYAKNITRILNEAPTGGETIAEVQNRVFAGLEKIKKSYSNSAPPQSPERDCGEQIKSRRSPRGETAAERGSDKNILIIAHAFVAKVINKYFNQQISEQDFFNFILPTAKIKEYRF